MGIDYDALDDAHLEANLRESAFALDAELVVRRTHEGWIAAVQQFTDELAGTVTLKSCEASEKRVALVELARLLDTA